MYLTSSASLCRRNWRRDRRMLLLPRPRLLDQPIVGRIAGSAVTHGVARRVRARRRNPLTAVAAAAPAWRSRRWSVGRRGRGVRPATGAGCRGGWLQDWRDRGRAVLGVRKRLPGRWQSSGGRDRDEGGRVAARDRAGPERWGCSWASIGWCRRLKEKILFIFDIQFIISRGRNAIFIKKDSNFIEEWNLFLLFLLILSLPCLNFWILKMCNY